MVLFPGPGDWSIHNIALKRNLNKILILEIKQIGSDK